MYQLLQLDNEEAYLNDPLWSDAPEELPNGSYILVREIKKALDGDDFKYIPSGQRKQVLVPGITQGDFNYYFSIHRFSTKLGLPNGGGWMNELPWVPEFLCSMQDTQSLIEAWVTNKRSKSTENVDPSKFIGG